MMNTKIKKHKTTLITAVMTVALVLALNCSQKEGAGGEGSGTSADGRIPANAKVVAASFYPVYIAAKNVTDGVAGVHLARLAQNHAGCLHNYQLSTADAATLERASAFIINGGGMEPFLERAVQLNRDLIIIDASSDIDFIIERKNDGGEDHAQHRRDANDTHEVSDSELVQIQRESSATPPEENFMFAHHREDAPHVTNPHVWMSVENHIRQVSAIAWRLSSWDGDNSADYNENAQQYITRLRALRDTAQHAVSAANGCDTAAAISHNGFAYLMRELGVHAAIVAQANHGASSANAVEIANAINTIRNEKIKVLFVDDAEAAVVRAIADDTGVRVVKLDMITSGEAATNAYINAMTANIAAVRRAMCAAREI